MSILISALFALAGASAAVPPRASTCPWGEKSKGAELLLEASVAASYEFHSWQGNDPTTIKTETEEATWRVEGKNLVVRLPSGRTDGYEQVACLPLPTGAPKKCSPGLKLIISTGAPAKNREVRHFWRADALQVRR